MNYIKQSIFTAVALFSMFSMPSIVNAGGQQAVNLDDKMREACGDKDEGDVCDFTNDKGESINGSCKRTGSADNKLYCVQNNG